MRKSEQRLWDRFRDAMKDQIFFERVENAVNAGRPDVDIMINGVTLSIELKSIQSWPRRTLTPVLGRGKGLNQAQKNWWLKWKHWGGLGFILVSVSNETFSIPCEFSETINTFTKEHFAARRVTWAEFVVQIKAAARQVQCERSQ